LQKTFKGKTIEKIIEAPKLRIEEGELAGQYLLNFFKDLGWNPELNRLDPSRIRTTKNVFDSIYDAVLEMVPDVVSVGMLMVNSGPSVDDDVPENSVFLLEGWLLPLKEEVE